MVMVMIRKRATIRVMLRIRNRNMMMLGNCNKIVKEKGRRMTRAMIRINETMME